MDFNLKTNPDTLLILKTQGKLIILFNNDELLMKDLALIFDEFYINLTKKKRETNFPMKL